MKYKWIKAPSDDGDTFFKLSDDDCVLLADDNGCGHPDTERVLVLTVPQLRMIFAKVIKETLK